MGCGINVKRSNIIFRGITFLWSDAFSFRSVWTLCGSFAFVVFAFVDSRQYPAFILINAAAWKLFNFWWCMCGFLDLNH